MNHDQIAQAIDAERAQIAHEIHDALLPLIFAASAAVQRQLDEYEKDDGDRGTDPVRLRQAFNWLQDAMRVGRQLLSQTYPPELADNSWDQAAQKTVSQLTDGLDQQSAPKITWQIEDESRRVPEAAAGACYRIVVEAIRNAIRHGKATEITVTGKQEDDHVIVNVIDNGSGFEVGEVPDDRFGIRSMKGRAILARGQLQLESQPGGPTNVQLSLPAAE